jgi:hypothetical protein
MRTVASGLTASLIVVLFLSAASGPAAHAAAASDFTSDVHRDLNAMKQNRLQGAALAIAAQDYQSSWDEFGSNILIDGTKASAERSLLDDILKDLRVQLAYNQKDERYLRLRHSSPEEILLLEGDGSGDLLPENYVEPHPSLDANPDANPSALDMPVDAIYTSGDTMLLDDVLAIPDSLIPPGGEWKPADITVFEAILNTANPDAAVPSETTSEVPPSDEPVP